MDYDKLADHRNDVARTLKTLSEEDQANNGQLHAVRDYGHFLDRDAFDRGCRYLQALDAILLSEQCEPEEV